VLDTLGAAPAERRAMIEPGKLLMEEIKTTSQGMLEVKREG
jgi:hypothetical protein